MIKIYYPRTFTSERNYIIDIIFDEFLGLAYEKVDYEDSDYKIILDNNASLVIRDAFFSCQEEENYLKLENIPSEISFGKNRFIVESDIPILYGNDEINITQEGITCGIDLFASTFFMLTRWEEYVNKARDMHNRFPAAASTAFKNSFIDRPVVNEYVEMLWNMLVHLGIGQKRKERKFDIILTHDVDHLSYWKGPIRSLQVLGADLLKRRNFPLFLRNLAGLIRVKTGNQKDPFDTFDYIMDLSEEANIKSRFYYMSGGVTKYDNHYRITEPAALNSIKKVKERGHIIGFHPSYDAYNNPDQWKKEKDRLEEVLGFQVKEGRQHYLRFEAPETWNIWNDHGMDMDCTVGYADREGFRCGTCYDYTVYDFLKRKKLQVKEFPLIVMEGSLFGYQYFSPEKMEEKIMSLVDITKKYQGNFVYLWHNSSFNTEYWQPIDAVYKNTLSNFKNLKL